MGKSHTKLTLVIVFLLSCVSAYAAGFANENSITLFPTNGV